MWQNLPEELKSYPNWVCWGRAGSDGRSRKIPYNPLTGSPAKANDPETWARFADASEAVRKGLYAGVGFEFGNSPFVGIDFDHCIDAGTEAINPQVEEWVRRLGSYAEKSQSGSGLHIIVRGETPGHQGFKRDWAEVYDTGRYFALTGDTPDPLPIADGGEALQALIALLSKPERKDPGGAAKAPGTGGALAWNASIGGLPDDGPPVLADGEILSIARRAANGTDFQALYDGRWEGKYPSQSEADLALCNKLAFYTTDPGQIDRLFRGSGLYREKWDVIHDPAGKRTYGQATIDKAIAETPNHYRGRVRPEEAFSPITGGSPQTAFEEGKVFRPLVPLDTEKAAAPPFPVEALPPVLRELSEAYALNLQVPPELIAMPALCTVAAAMQGKAAVHPKPGWYEPLPLWFVGIADPSERKSAALAAVTRPAYDILREMNASLTPEIARYNARVKLLEGRRKRLEKQVADGGTEEAEKAYYEVCNELAALEAEPVLPLHLFADDVTPEALSELMLRGHGSAAIFSAEAGIFGTIGGRYTGGIANTDIFTKGFSGEFVRVNRITRGSVDIPHPVLTLCLMVQPGVWEETAAGNQRFVDSGLLARFLPCRPGVIPERAYNTPPVPDAVRFRYEALMRTLLSHRYPGKGERPSDIRFSAGAAEASERWFTWLEPQVRLPTGDYSGPKVKEAAGKAHGITARLSALFHICNAPDNPWDTGVSAEEYRDARAVMERYFLPQIVTIYGGLRADSSAEADARYIWQKLKAMRDGEGVVPRRDLLRACHRRIPKGSILDAGLSELARRGYIAVRESKAESGPGRVRTEILLNPEAEGL